MEYPPTMSTPGINISTLEKQPQKTWNYKAFQYCIHDGLNFIKFCHPLHEILSFLCIQ